MSEPGQNGRDGEDRSERQQEFLNSWNKSMMGGRPSIRLPMRGLRGLAVIAGSVAVVIGVVIGGVAAIDSVAGRKNKVEADNAALTSTLVETTAPSPTATATPTQEPTATKEPKKTRTKEAEPVRTRTVTRTAEPTSSPKAKKSEKQTKAQKKKAAKAAQQAEATPGTRLQAIGGIKNLATGMCVDLPGTGAAGENVLATQYYCTPGAADNQAYETITATDGSFLLRNVKSQWCLDVNGSGNVDAGIVVNTHTCLLGDSDNQMFRKQAQGDGFYLVHVKSGLCLDVSNENNNQLMPDQKLTLWHCSPDDDHVWTFG